MTTTAKQQLSVRLSVFIAAAVAVFLLIGGAAEAEGPPQTGVEYVVATGDTLWGIAAVHTGPGDDVRDLISDIKQLSGIETSTIHPGQILRIPRS